MDRRSLLKRSAAAGLFIGLPSTLQFFITSCNSNEGPQRINFLSVKEFELLEKICDIMIPATNTPGAIQTHATYFVEIALRDCVPPGMQEQVRKGVQQIHENNFMALTATEQEAVIIKLDSDAFENGSDHHWYRTIKKLACIGHFTSEKVGKSALDYRAAWGVFQPCIDFKSSDKAMAKNYLQYY